MLVNIIIIDGFIIATIKIVDIDKVGRRYGYGYMYWAAAGTEPDKSLLTTSDAEHNTYTGSSVKTRSLPTRTILINKTNLQLKFRFKSLIVEKVEKHFKSLMAHNCK